MQTPAEPALVRGKFLIRANFYDITGTFISRTDLTGMNPGAITAWTRVGGRVTAPANSAWLEVQYLLYMSSGWVNIDDVEVTVVAPAVATEITKYYMFGSQRVAMRKNGVLTYLHADHLGSTVLETNALGVTTSDEKYKAYGKQRDTGTVSTDHRFTGQKEDASGLQYFHARFYDPVIGMFVSPDTVVPDAGRVSAYNRTMYARGNPLVYNDPSGHQDVCSGVCPAPGIDPQIVQQAIQQTVDMARSAGPYAPYVAGAAAGAASVPIVAGGGYLVTMWAIQDNGPAYVVPAPYDPGKVQESYPLPGSTTVSIQGTPLTGDGLTTSVPGTSDAGIATPKDPGVTLTSPSLGDNIMSVGSTPSGLRNASAGLKELYSSGNVKRNTVISIRETLKGNGFTGGITRNRQGYLFTNNSGEQVRIMYRNGKWDLRIQNVNGNYLDEYGNVADPNNAHSIYVESK